MIEPVFEEPPGAGRGGVEGGIHSATADKLRAQPMAWARVSEHPTRSRATNTATAWKRGTYVGLKVNEFEAVVRVRPNGWFGVWARYVGESQR